MPDELRARVEVLAKTNGRSTNAEIVAALDAATGGAPLRVVPVEALLKEVAERLGTTVQIHVAAGAPPALPAKTGTRKAKAK